MMSYKDLVKKHYILRIQHVNPFNMKKCFHPYEGFGIECGKGWYDLLDSLCTGIEKELDKDLDSKKNFYITQIKEKFGGLRFYVSSATDRVYNFISTYEKKSYHVCEICGKKGNRCCIQNWLSTLCKECERKHLLKLKI